MNAHFRIPSDRFPCRATDKLLIQFLLALLEIPSKKSLLCPNRKPSPK